MTRRTGQITLRQTVLGGLLVLGAATGIVAALSLLLGRDEQVAPLEAPAEPAAEQPCPEPPPRPLSTAVRVTAEDLIECPATYDHRLVRYRGEVVRAVLRRGNRAWVQLNDDPYALDLGPLPVHRLAVGGNSGIPVLIPIAIADQITYVGNARHQGDILQVVGTYRRADPVDDGGPTIQAHSARIRPGHRVARPANPYRALAAAGLMLIATTSAAAARLRHMTRR